MIKTSVVIPVYNVEPYIDKCLNSVFGQNQQEIEIIIVDDGSTDGSMDLVREYMKEKHNIKIIQQENRGLGAARNTGLKNAIGKYIYFLDSDDLISPDTLETCFQCAEKDNLQVVFFDAFPFLDGQDNGGGIQKNLYDRRRIILNHNEVYTGSSFFQQYVSKKGFLVPVWLQYVNRDFLIKNNIVFQEGILHEDIAYTFKLILLAERIKYLPRLFYQRRIRAGSITQGGVIEKRIEGHFSAINKMIDDLRELGTGGEITKELYYMARLFQYSLALGEKRQLAEKLKEMALQCIVKLQTVLRDQGTTGAYFGCMIYKAYIKQFHEENPDIIQRFLQYDEIVDKMRIDILQQIPLGDIRKNVAIYGTGVHTDILLKAYKRLIGDIKAHIYYINTDVSDQKMYYRGQKVYNVYQLGDFPVDVILISSVKYEDYIYKTLRKIYGNQYKIIRLYDKDQYCLFYEI